MLPSGVVAFVKRDCPTCELVVPVLAEIAKRSKLTIFSQDDPAFPEGLDAQDETGLALSWHHGIGCGVHRYHFDRRRLSGDVRHHHGQDGDDL